MAAKRCEGCGIRYPSTMMQCGVCGEPPTYTSTEMPDEDWQERVRLGLARQKALTAAGRLREYNIRRLVLECNLTLEDAEALADIRDVVRQVQRLQARGCPPGLVRRLLE